MKNKKGIVIEFIAGLSDGGAETLVKDYCLYLKKDGYMPVVVALAVNQSTANYRILQKENVEIIVIYKYWNFFTKTFNRAFGALYVSHRMKNIVREKKPKCIHSHLAQLHYLAPISSYLKNTKLLYTCHSIPERFFCGSNKRELSAAKKLIRNNDLHIIALHKQMLEVLCNILETNNVSVVYNGIEIERFINVKKEASEIRKEIGVPVDAFVIGNVGRFIYIKNHKLLVDIFAEVLQENKNAFLLMIGDGSVEEMREITDYLDRKLCGGRYLILSHRSDLPELYKAMDVFVFTSLFEGFSLSLLEAQASGLKCITSDEGSSYGENVFSTNTIIRKLDDPLDLWADSVLNESKSNANIKNLLECDMNVVIKRIECMIEE